MTTGGNKHIRLLERKLLLHCNILNRKGQITKNGLVYILDPNWVIAVHADILVPKDARSSAGTMLTLMLAMLPFKFVWL